MIEFKCPHCRRQFRLKDGFAGKKATCNKCGKSMTIPQARAELPSSSAPRQLSVRERRLVAEAGQVRQFFHDWPLVRIKSITGDPPELYQFEFNIRGVEKLSSRKPVFRDSHVAEIQLTMDYPRLSPQCRMLTPIFHPNIDLSSICVGDHWTAGERLADLVIRIGEMIAYQAYNIKSPLNGEAAMWADLNPDLLPVDSRNLRPAEVEHA